MYELFAEIGYEITSAPFKFVAELVQFVLLLTIIYAVAIGFGKRKGMLIGILDKRRESVAGRIERAGGAEAALAHAHEDADAMIAQAQTEAAAIVSQAQSGALAEAATARDAADAEAARVRKHAQDVMDNEFAEMHVEIRDQLVDLVAGATRSILNESLSAQEQRELIQDAVASGIDRIEAAGSASSRRAAAAAEVQ
jgi:F-type H+-transporting ATPase subunit b